MKLIWHIISKDIIRDRWALLMWAFLFVGQVGIGVFARNSTGVDADTVVYMQIGSVGLVFLQVIMGYILVARLVQADALIGTSMFWRTRPISAGRLLAAKVAGVLAIFAVLPVLLLLPWWLYCQFGYREVLWAAVDTFGWQLLMIAPAFLVASLTDDLGRVLLWTLLLVIGLFSWIVLLQSSLTASLGRSYNQVGPSVMFTRLWVCGLILMVGSMAIAAHQYLTRHFVRSVVLVVACLGLIALVGQVWPWNWGRSLASLHKPALAPVEPGVVDQLSFTVEPAKGTFGSGFKGKGEGDDKDAALNLKLRVRGLPDELAVVTENVRQTWSWPNGLKLTRGGRAYSWWNDSPGDAVLRRAYALPPEDPETLQWMKVRRERTNARINANRAARGLPPIPPYAPPPRPAKGDGTLLSDYVSLPNSILAKMKVEPPAYRADAKWILYRPEAVAELPLKVGARAVGGARTFHIAQFIERRPLVISTHASVTQYGVWNSAAVSSEFRNWFFRERFAAVNRVTGDINEVRNGQVGSKQLFVGGVIVDWNVLEVYPTNVIRNDQDVVKDPQWIEHTTLVFLVDRDVALFDRVVETAKFELEPDPATP